jgi:hypothetical protein
MKVIKNTYPIWPNVAHAEPGDIAKWDHHRGKFSLIRESDGKTLFSVDVDGNGNKSNGQPPTACGIISQVKSKGWILEIEP